MELLNTLYVMTPRAYVRLDHETVRVDVEGKTTLRIPLIHLQGITVFGDVLVSPGLIPELRRGRAVHCLARSKWPLQGAACRSCSRQCLIAASSARGAVPARCYPGSGQVDSCRKDPECAADPSSRWSGGEQRLTTRLL